MECRVELLLASADALQHQSRPGFLRTGVREFFVPEGLNGRIQAIYCLEHVRLRIRPVGARSDPYAG
jgi:hypothetical protein